MRFDYYPETDSLYIELKPGRERREQGGSQVIAGEGDRELVIDVDADGVPTGIDIHSFASEIVDLSKLEVEGPIFGMVRAEGPEKRAG